MVVAVQGSPVTMGLTLYNHMIGESHEWEVSCDYDILPPDYDSP